ncbi:hypothetical protein AMTR_s00017p00136200 [Amborella trichopoda]|uniref:Inhibitor I9 domain-containing protein n=1 Tax=Amborella trichopoda TaxID=13333 RepID=W1PN26_AMBTC|nr:hypothetical protein AMTR_s00017p00136200 [Amborella trichopoda]
MRSTVKKALIIGLAISALLFVAMADSGSSSEEAKAAVQIVYTEKPGDGEEPEAFHIKTLASVLGSEEAAKDAILYSYKEAASGFSAKLTPQQVAELSMLSGVDLRQKCAVGFNYDNTYWVSFLQAQHENPLLVKTLASAIQCIYDVGLKNR